MIKIICDKCKADIKKILAKPKTEHHGVEIAGQHFCLKCMVAGLGIKLQAGDKKFEVKK